MPETARRSRDRHLFDPGPKRLLTIDGGGVRGAVAIAFLERIEDVLSEQNGGRVRLCDYFDLISGTSTGAIIATALALGHSATDVRIFYESLAPKVFRRPFYRMGGWKSKFDARRLRAEISTIIGSRTLDSEDLVTGLGLVLKRMDTGSSWLVMNNPKSAFWNELPDAPTIGNRDLPLANLVRASAAAPHFFEPELIEILPGGPRGVFVDGGLTPHNNPSLLMLMAILLPAFNLNWKTGPDNLTIVSVGTGSFRPTISPFEARYSPALQFAVKSLASQISENQTLTLALMSWMSDCTTPWTINSEVGSLADVTWPSGSLLRFLRYDIRLEQQWLRETLGVDATPRELGRLRALDQPRSIPRLYEIATAAAAMQIRVADWPA